MADIDASFPPPFLAGGGACAALIAERDWSTTPLGPIEGWPGALKVAAAILLRSPVPMAMLWGEDGVMIYNDAYSVFAGGRHPALLGSKVREGWPEVAAFNDEVMRVGLSGGTLRYRDQELTLFRHGAAEQVWMDLDYSPVPGDDGRPAGVLAIVRETTERVRAGRRVEGERARLKLMFAQAPGLIAMLSGPDHVFELVNPGYSGLIGGRDVVGKPAREALPELVGQGHLALLDQVYRTGEPFVGRAMPAAHRDGEDGPIVERLYDFVYQPLFDEEGRVTGIFAEGQDVTDRARAEAKVRESEAELRLITDALPVLVAYVDRDLRYRFVNRAYGEWFGRPRDAILGLRLRDLLGEEAFASLRGCVEAVLAGEPRRYAAQVERRPGEPRDIEASYIPRADDSGAVIGFHVLIQDMTERRAAEARASEEAAERAAILGQLAEGVIVTDADGRIAFVNEAAERLHGVKLLGVDPDGYSESYHLLTEDGRPYPPRDLPLARAVLDGEVVSDARWRIRRPDGSEVVAVGSARPVTGPDGARRGAVLTLRDDTARTAAEERLLASERELRLITDALPIMVSYIDRDERYRLINTAYERWFEVQRDQVLGRSVRELLGDEAYRPRRNRIAAALRGEAQRFEAFTPKPDGTRRETEVHYVPRRGDGGAVEGFYTLVIDVTDRAEAEQRLRASEARLRAVVEAAPVGLIFADADGRITGGNARVEELVGHPILPSANVDEYDRWVGFHADGRRVEAREYPLARALEGEERPELEVLYQRGDGRRTWIRFVAAAKRDEEGRVVGGVVASLDIDAERRAQDELKRLNADLEARVAEALAERRVFADVVEGTEAVVQVVDRDLRLLAVNKAAAAASLRLFGHTLKPGDLVLDRLAGLPDEQAKARQLWTRALTGERFTQEVEVGPADGERRWYELSFNPLRDPDGAIIGAFQFAQNVTARREGQERLAQAEDALRQAQKMEAVGQLTGGIAHDFNNLLGAVVGGLDLIRRRPDDVARVRRYAEAALQAAERGAKLTGQLLAFSRAQRIELKPLTLGGLVEGMRDLLGRTLGPMVRLGFRLDEDGLPVLSDPTQLEMAVLNLAINARDAMPDGGELTIATAPRFVEGDPELADGHYVELSVADTGQGMPAEVVARAFDPFFTTKGVGKGTGLGLSQVYGIARQSGGAVRIDSAPGRGTVVRLLLPRTDAPVRAGDGRRADGEGEGARGSATILLVDDDADMRAVLADQLEALGYRVVQAADGPAGLALLDEAAPDLLMLDFAMPGMTGAEAARAARARRPELPIVFATGYADTAAIEAAAGPDAPVLRKPFRLEELQAVVAGALGRV